MSLSSLQTEALIVSASRRTDIPAFYSEWFRRRVRAGFCLYRNPFNPRAVHRVELTPDAVAGIVFWTRDARPLLAFVPELDGLGYASYFTSTLTDYPSALEPRAPHGDEALRAFGELADAVGPRRVVWRYDPVLLAGEMTVDWHKRNFSRIAGALAGRGQRVVVSVVDAYRKTQRGLSVAGVGEVCYEVGAYAPLLEWLHACAAAHGFELQTCCEPDLRLAGVKAGRCVEGDLLAEVAASLKQCRDAPAATLHRQRPGCLCHRSVDIGTNGTCGFGCVYCYATRDHAAARRRLQTHQPRWNSLDGELAQGG